MDKTKQIDRLIEDELDKLKKLVEKECLKIGFRVYSTNCTTSGIKINNEKRNLTINLSFSINKDV